MAIRHSKVIAGALVAGAILAMGGPAFASKHGSETETNTIPLAPGAAMPQPAFQLVPDNSSAAAVQPAPAAVMPGMVQPRAGAPDDVAALVRQADAALRARRAGEARDRLERAETAMLNARTDGRQGYRIQVQDISAARGALAAGNIGDAQRGVGRLMQLLDRPAI